VKKVLKSAFCGILIAMITLSISGVFAEEHSFIAKKSSARINQAGDIVECIVTASDKNLYSYRAQLVYDRDLLEFESVDPVYIQGEGELIKYYGTVPESPMNVPGSLVYKKDEKETGFYAEDNIPGIYRSISTRLGHEPRTEGDIVLNVKLKAKKAGSSFIYLMDEQTAVKVDVETVINQPVQTTLTVKSGGDSLGAAEINDVNDVAYPWRTTDAVFQETNIKSNIQEPVIEGKRVDVSYTSTGANIIVNDDGTVLCNMALDRTEKYPPTVARVSAIGGYNVVKRVKYDVDSKTLIFAIDDFGEHIITNSTYSVSDCTDDSEVYNAVCYLKSIGVVDAEALNFDPNRKITRAEFVKMLVNCAGEADNGAMCWYKDVDISSWYYKYIATAVKYGIITDNGGNFMPEAQLSVAEAKQMLQNTSNVINGSGTITLNKKDNLTRGEAAIEIQNMLWLKLR